MEKVDLVGIFFIILAHEIGNSIYFWLKIFKRLQIIIYFNKKISCKLDIFSFSY